MMSPTVTTQHSSPILSFMTAIAATPDFGGVIRHMLWKPTAALRAPLSAFEEDGAKFRAESLAQSTSSNPILTVGLPRGWR